MAKSPLTLPSIGAPAKVEIQIDSPPELKIPTTPEETKIEQVNEVEIAIKMTDRKVSVPFLENFIEGYSRTRIDLKLTNSRANALNRFQLALEAKRSKAQAASMFRIPLTL
ncbi:MAG: hypothetical protein IPJ55_17610 [Chloracidobacterium sp.]|nr:hypothetical protein [Chloracidobacterium sp.]